MVQSLLYHAIPFKKFWENVMFESISLVSYDVIAPKTYVAPTSNSTNPLGLQGGAVEYLASCLSKSKQLAKQLSIEGGGADNETSTMLHKNLQDLMDTDIHLMIAYNMRVKNLVEPVWLCSNGYICNSLNKSFFSSDSFSFTVHLTFEFALCLVLDFGDAWVAKRGLGSSDGVTLTVPRSSQCHMGSNREVKGCLPNKAPWALGTILDSKALGLNGRKEYLISCLLQHKVIPHPLRNSGTCQKTNEGKSPKRIRLLIALVELRPFTTKSEVEFNQWDELSQFLFRERRFTNPIATNGALLGEFIFAIGWRKCSTKNEQFGQSLGYVEDNLLRKIQNCYKSLGVPSFDQVNCEADIPTNPGAFEFASTLTFTMNGFKNSPHLDKDALGWWFQAHKQTGQIQRDVSKRCTGGKLIFPNEHFWIDLSKFHGLIQVVWASSTFFHYTDPAQDNESMTPVGMSGQCSSRLARRMWRKSHSYYEIGERVGCQIRDGNTISSHLEE
ncbi:hypothetical protein O181_078760 [Austropuccinia psidii MF-1]|uniref:Tet-like 2OG-Fe(II) oxygenase domain-containing protein n=1 Tax=Austropuccinia psidii MF-1 TaxID=1389203 RepID=A0A9Q3FK78_9BASI|nr:hypothetical protein [Austropuccinia psidii MF-1]